MVVCDVGLGKHRQRRAVLHDDVAVGIQDVTARRGSVHRGVLVVLGLLFEGGAGKHLHAEQLRGKRAEDQAGNNAHGGEAALQVVTRVCHRLSRRAAAGDAAGRHAVGIGKRAAHAHRLDGADIALDADVLGLPAAKHRIDRHQDGSDHQKGHEAGYDSCEHARPLSQFRRAQTAVLGAAGKQTRHDEVDHQAHGAVVQRARKSAGEQRLQRVGGKPACHEQHAVGQLG